MDDDQISLQIKKCKHLKFRFHGVYAADNYPLDLPNSIGTHCVVLAKRYAYPILFFADTLALPITTYKHFFSRLQMCRNMKMIMDIIEHRRDTQFPLQSSDSQLCGLFCIYIAHSFYSEKFLFVPDVNELQLIDFLKRMEWKLIKFKTITFYTFEFLQNWNFSK